MTSTKRVTFSWWVPPTFGRGGIQNVSYQLKLFLFWLQPWRKHLSCSYCGRLSACTCNTHRLEYVLYGVPDDSRIEQISSTHPPNWVQRHSTLATMFRHTWFAYHTHLVQSSADVYNRIWHHWATFACPGPAFTSSHLTAVDIRVFQSRRSALPVSRW